MARARRSPCGRRPASRRRSVHPAGTICRTPAGQLHSHLRWPPGRCREASPSLVYGAGLLIPLSACRSRGFKSLSLRSNTQVSAHEPLTAMRHARAAWPTGHNVVRDVIRPMLGEWAARALRRRRDGSHAAQVSGPRLGAGVRPRAAVVHAPRRPAGPHRPRQRARGGWRSGRSHMTRGHRPGRATPAGAGWVNPGVASPRSRRRCWRRDRRAAVRGS